MNVTPPIIGTKISVKVKFLSQEAKYNRCHSFDLARNPESPGLPGAPYVPYQPNNNKQTTLFVAFGLIFPSTNTQVNYLKTHMNKFQTDLIFIIVTPVFK